MSNNLVLIISNPEDVHVHKVVEKIKELGGKPLLFFPEMFGDINKLEIGIPSDKLTLTNHLTINTDIYDFHDIYSIWYRRPRLVSLSKYQLEPEALEFSRDEWKHAIEAAYVLAKDALWVSHPDKLREAARKPLQLIMARKIGFKIPHTLITSDPNQARKFIYQFDGKVIVKATGTGWVYTRNEEDVTYVMTNRITSENLQSIDEFEIAPVTIQEEISKAYEVRVNIVGQKIIAIKIDSQKSKISEVDWRRYDVKKTPYTLYYLPDDLEQKCLKLTQLLGLEFGAIDLICQPDGDYVFLEINGNGQFLWAEELSNVEISSAIAGLLSGVTPPLRLKNLE